MQTGHIREQSPARRLTTGPDYEPPRPVCDMVGCGHRADVIERCGRYLCATHTLAERSRLQLS